MKKFLSYLLRVIGIAAFDVFTDILFSLEVTNVISNNLICFDPGTTKGVGSGSPPACQANYYFTNMMPGTTMLVLAWVSTSIGLLHVLLLIGEIVYVLSKGKGSASERLVDLAEQHNNTVCGWKNVVRFLVALLEDIPQWLVALVIMDFTGQLTFANVASCLVSTLSVSKQVADAIMRGCCGVPGLTGYNDLLDEKRDKQSVEMYPISDDTNKGEVKKLRCYRGKQVWSGGLACMVCFVMSLFLFFSIGSVFFGPAMFSPNDLRLPANVSAFQLQTADRLNYAVVSVDILPICANGYIANTTDAIQQCTSYPEDYFVSRTMPTGGGLIAGLSGRRSWVRIQTNTTYHCPNGNGTVAISHFCVWDRPMSTTKPIFSFGIQGVTNDAAGLVSTMDICVGDGLQWKLPCVSQKNITAIGVPWLTGAQVVATTYSLCDIRIGVVN